MKFTLRPYQENTVHLLREYLRSTPATDRKPRPIVCLPTGGGKTVVFSHLAEQAQRKNSHVSVVAHRTELIDQAQNTMQAYGINPLMIDYGMVQTYVRSPHKIPEMDVCIIDEAHCGDFRRFIELIPDTVQVIGFTATPVSASKKKPLRYVFDHVIAPVQISELIRDGFLSRPVYHLWKLDESNLEKDFSGEFSESSQAKVFHLDNLKEAYKNRIGKTIIFTSSIQQCKDIKELFPEVFMVHSKMHAKERKAIVDEYKRTPNATIVNCGILTAGFDDPSIETVIVYRATTSVALWLQMCGRGSRVIDGVKNTFYIFDLGNNRQRLLAWEADRDWPSIFDLQGRKLKDKEAPMKACIECEAIIYASAVKCPYCGADQPKRIKEAAKADTVEVINSYSELPDYLQKPYEQMTVKELIDRAQYGSPQIGRPFKIGWVLSHVKKRDNYTELIHEIARIKGYKSGWVKNFL